MLCLYKMKNYFKKVKIKLSVILLLIFFVCYTQNCQSAFIDPGWSTRGAGKGGAFIATVDDASSIVWNPAALSQIYMRESALSYHKPYAGLDGINVNMGNISLVFPIAGVAGFGAAASAYNVNSLYQENIFQLSAAKELSEVIPALGNIQLAVGVNVKYLYHKYVWDSEIKALGDLITEKESSSAITVDVGILFQPVYEVPVGINVKNLLPADVGLVYEDLVPLEAELGIAYRLGTIRCFEEITPEVKVSYRNQQYGNKFNYAAGLESWFNMHTLGLRLGCNRNEAAFGVSFEQYFGNIGIRIDYAAVLSFAIGDNFGSHRVSTALKF